MYGKEAENRSVLSLVLNDWRLTAWWRLF